MKGAEAGGKGGHRERGWGAAPVRSWHLAMRGAEAGGGGGNRESGESIRVITASGGNHRARAREAMKCWVRVPGEHQRDTVMGSQGKGKGQGNGEGNDWDPISSSQNALLPPSLRTVVRRQGLGGVEECLDKCLGDARLHVGEGAKGSVQVQSIGALYPAPPENRPALSRMTGAVCSQAQQLLNPRQCLPAR